MMQSSMWSLKTGILRTWKVTNVVTKPFFFKSSAFLTLYIILLWVTFNCFNSFVYQQWKQRTMRTDLPFAKFWPQKSPSSLCEWCGKAVERCRCLQSCDPTRPSVYWGLWKKRESLLFESLLSFVPEIFLWMKWHLSCKMFPGHTLSGLVSSPGCMQIWRFFCRY